MVKQCVLLMGLSCALSTLAVVPPYFEDFKPEVDCGGDCTASCNIITPFWFNEDLMDDQDWKANSGKTSMSNTGPEFDHTRSDDSGFYLYIETSSPCQNQDNLSILTSLFLELANTQNPQVSFWYHMFGGDMGLLHVDVLDADLNPTVIDVIPPISDNLDLWQKKTIDLSTFVPDSIFLRFRHVHSGMGNEGDVAIDDFEFVEDLDLIFRNGFE